MNNNLFMSLVLLTHNRLTNKGFVMVNHYKKHNVNMAIVRFINIAIVWPSTRAPSAAQLVDSLIIGLIVMRPRFC